MFGRLACVICSIISVPACTVKCFSLGDVMSHNHFRYVFVFVVRTTVTRLNAGGFLVVSDVTVVVIMTGFFVAFNVVSVLFYMYSVCQ